MGFSRAARLILFLMICGAVATPGGTRAGESDWAPFEFLVGQWDASGTGAPGVSTGSFSFEKAADGHALLRRNESNSASGRHTDIMLIYREAQGGFRAEYADNEGHVIHYTVTSGSDGKEAVFTSPEASAAPRFRLSYRLNADATVAVKFEISPPGSAEFKTYVEGVAHRR